MTTEAAKPTKPALSKSKLNMIGKCPKQYEYRYLENIIAPPSVAMHIGTGTHTGIEKNLLSKRDTGSLLPEEQVIEAATESFKNTWDGSPPALDEDEREIGEKAVRGRAIDQVAQLAQLHHREAAPRIVPVHLERYFRLELKRYDHDLDGFIDIQEADAIRDTKTTSKAPPEDEADRSLELSIYALGVKTIDGKAPAKVKHDFLVKTKKPQYIPRESTRTDEDFKAVLLRVEAASKLIAAGAFYPTNADNWWCSRKFCGYFDRCPFGARRRVQG